MNLPKKDSQNNIRKENKRPSFKENNTSRNSGIQMKQQSTDDHYLSSSCSSIGLETPATQAEQEPEESCCKTFVQGVQVIEKWIVLFIQVLFSLIMNTLLLVLMPILLLFVELIQIARCDIKLEYWASILFVNIVIIVQSYFLYDTYKYIFVPEQNLSITLLVYDLYVYYFSIILVTTYISRQIFQKGCDYNSYCGAVFNFLDTRIKIDYSGEIEMINNSRFPASCSSFQHFSFNSNQARSQMSVFYKGFFQNLKINKYHYFALNIFQVLKCILLYFYITDQYEQLSPLEICDFFVALLIYMWMTISLYQTFSNGDLERKKNQMNIFNDYINFDNVDRTTYQQKLDITCSISLECWDNARKQFLSFEKEKLTRLEGSFFCLVFYYAYLILICLTYYFDLNWLIPKGSLLLNPVSIISSTFNFFSLSLLLIFRFDLGTEFNDSFDQLERSIDILLDLATDLLIMYDHFFIQQQKLPKSTNQSERVNPQEELKFFNSQSQIKTEQKEEQANSKKPAQEPKSESRYSAYGLIIKKIKQNSKKQINQNGTLQAYKLSAPNPQWKAQIDSEKKKIRISMIETMIANFQKLKSSIHQDRKFQSYKFLNVAEVRTNEFIFTLALALVTTLPTIVPKFINFYK